MLYLKSITLDKFKSFKHAELLMSKGFTCVVGPNGSGKSVIFDALSVALGEPSPQKLRVSALGQLINNTVKHKAGEFSKAHIKLEFEGEGEPIVVTKVIRSDSKTLYKLNGKTLSRREVIEFFSAKNVRVDDTTTIAQGEIDGLSKLNSKQRRELIDVAAGIKEFEYKKTEALRELDKVDQKISEANAILNERQGFLKMLEKQKEQAESFTKMTQRVKHLRYSILVSRHLELKTLFDGASKEIATFESKKNDIMFKRNELAAKRDQLTQESTLLQKEFNSLNSTSGETRAKLENLNNELSKLEVEVPTLKASIEDLNTFMLQSNAELKESKETIKSNNALMAELAKSITKLDAEIAKYGVIADGLDFDTEMENLDVMIASDQNHVFDLQSYIQKLQADIAIAVSRKADSEKLSVEVKAKKDELAAAKEEKQKAITETKKRMQDGLARIEKLNIEFTKNSKAHTDTERDILTLQEQKWQQSQSKEGNIASKLADKFGAKDGFYGKAASLCSYDMKYASAVETSAANRFEYFVTDSIKSASVMIDYLKKNNLGRATFIPMDDLNSERMESKKEKDITPVLDVIKYDAKFSRVFNYIFNNTYIIDNANDSKKYGVGRHRYVTLEGELIEQSGIISGGSQRNRLSLAAIENKLKATSEENLRLKTVIEDLASAISDSKKEQAILDVQLKSYTAELSTVSADLSAAEKRHTSIRLEVEAFEKDLAKMNKEVELKDKEKLELVSKLTDHKDARKQIHDKYLEATKGGTNTKKMKAEKEKADTLRKEAEGYKIKNAELQKEAELLMQKCDSLAKALETKQSQLKESKETLKEKELRKEVLSKSKSEIEKEINSKSETSKKSYSKIQAITDEIGKLSVDYGKYEVELNVLERQINEIRIKKGTSETRLSDITAELKAYDTTITPLKIALNEMEAEVNVLSSKIAELGNVNLTAPEIYEEKKREVDEAYSKMSTLQTEKEAVLRMMEEIDSKKLQTFMDMLNEVNKNFIKLYNYVFPGKASIVLENEKDPLNSGIHIKVSEGKTEKQFMSMSGGERAIISLMLLFSIHMGRKSSLYIFDEVDAALDKENAKKLSTLVKQMSKEAQFIVISHNDSLIVNADAAIGVVKTEGESRAIGVDVASMIKKQAVV